MKMKSLKSQLNKHQPTLGSWITIGNEITTEIMSKIGFDWLTVDMEHSAIDLSMTQNLIRIIQANNVAALVRVGENDPNIIKRVMDAGAQGVIVPMVNSADEAQMAVDAVKYPPLGKRGVGLARAQGYGTDFEGYKKWVNKESVVIIQIEHIDAVNNFEEIMKVKNIDGFIVGPYDLSASIGKPGAFEDKKVKSSLKKVMRLSKKHKYNAGFHVIPPDYNEVKRRQKEGFKFIGFSLDSLFLANACQKELVHLNRFNNIKIIN